ncbi:hypothetical protein ACOSP7_026736 [Xanthoceras sorbifolium]|uniref:Uncharacterized protein n=1 Tax=Xanthoceras sorbifolium TaxID=99658 RepID=A0ABQ8HF23_9ROSI|nr:hypothetical protein JRO89_XS11G0077700 [Xanthoceras sorbifolium]
MVYSASADGKIKAWGREGSRTSHAVKGILEGHKDVSLNSVVVSEDGSGSADKSIGIWNKEAYGKICKVGVITGHEGPVKCLQASSPNSVGGGFLLYSGGLDKTVRVWWVPKQHSADHKEDNPTTPSSTQEKSITLC